MEIEFVDGGIYRYNSVPPDVHRRLMQAPSKGAFFGDHIKDRYVFRRLR